ncbi:MAG: aminopeptidase P family protein [Clostridia bacterium]|nr:aminopeptidase P family protein [Clostridia bacterium]
MTNAEVQQIAKLTMTIIKSEIKVGMTLQELRQLAERKMKELGATSFWYWNIGAFIFSGRQTTLSVSGKRYRTAKQCIKEDDIITIDLSPQINNVWGDYARTIIIENGVVINHIDKISNSEWRNGLLMEEKLHSELLKSATPNTTFEQLHEYMNEIIIDNGYINLDFAGNLGHSIVTNKRDRIYIEKGNNAKLGSVEYFTFEPHIAVRSESCNYGFKKENIYYFNKGKLIEL